MAREELLVIDQTYELLKWFLGRLEKFPRSHRYGLGQQIEQRLYAVFDGLMRAKYATAADKREALIGVNLDLESLRMLCRLAHELGMLPHKSQEYAVREMIEIGRMVAGGMVHACVAMQKADDVMRCSKVTGRTASSRHTCPRERGHGTQVSQENLRHLRNLRMLSYEL